MRHTSPAKLGAIPVQVPPTRAEQKQVAERLNDLLAESQWLERVYQAKLRSLTELKQSLLQKAFSGELTADRAEANVQEAVV